MTIVLRPKLSKVRVSSHWKMESRSKIPFRGPEQRRYAEIHIIIFLIVLYLFGKRRQNCIWICSWLMLAGLCFLENCSSLLDFALNRSSFQTSNQCEISFFLVVSYNSIRDYVHPSVGPSVGWSVSRSVDPWCFCASEPANNFFHVYKLVNNNKIRNDAPIKPK